MKMQRMILTAATLASAATLLMASSCGGGYGSSGGITVTHAERKVEFLRCYEHGYAATPEEPEPADPSDDDAMDLWYTCNAGWSRGADDRVDGNPRDGWRAWQEELRRR